MFAMILVARSASAIKDIIVAWKFGTEPVADGYVFVFNLVGLPVSIWYSIFIVCLVPISMTSRQQDPPDHQRLLDELLFWTLVTGACFGLFFLLLLLVLFATGASGLGAPALRAATFVAPWLCLIIPLGFLTHYGSAILMTRGRHRNTIFEGLPAFVLAASLLVLPFGGLQILVIGTVAGAAVHLGAIWASLSSSGRLPRPRPGFGASAWPVLIGGVGAMLMAQILYALAGIIDQFFAARVGSGAIASLGYANRIAGLFLTLGATAIGRAVLPVFSRIDPARLQALKRLGFQWSVIMLAVGAVLAAAGWLLSEPLVRWIFERGSFDRDDTLLVSELLRWSVLQIPFHFAGMVVSNALFSRRRYGIVAVVAAASLSTKLIASFLLVGHLGLVGLVIATGLFYAVNFMLLALTLNRNAMAVPEEPATPGR